MLLLSLRAGVFLSSSLVLLGMPEFSSGIVSLFLVLSRIEGLSVSSMV